MWYICLFPLILPSTKIHLKWKGIILLTAWIAGQVYIIYIYIYRSSNLNSYIYTSAVQKAIWLNYAYQLEFLAQHTFFQLWLSGSLFFIINAWVMTELIMNHQYETIFNTSDKVRWVWGMGDPGSKRL